MQNLNLSIVFSHSAFIGPLQTFLDGEMKNITRERKILENRRLDLDACKGKVRKARAMQLQPVVSLYPSRHITDIFELFITIYHQSPVFD